MGLYDNPGIPFLSIITYLPLAGAIILMFAFNKENGRAIKRFALGVAIVDFFLSIPLWLYFDPHATGRKMFQFVEKWEWIPSLGVSYSFGIDGIALLLILLTTLTGVIAIYSSFAAVEHRQKEYYILLLMLQTGM